MSQKVEQELSSTYAYSPLLPSLPEAEFESPPLAGGESYEWEAVGNLDSFLTRVYRYWHERGFVTMLVSRVLNLVALAFTIAFSAFLLLFVNWSALHSACILADTCDILEVALYKHPLLHNGIAWNVLSITYLAIFGLYWLWTLVHFVMDCAAMAEMRHFFSNKLGVSERQVQVMTWAEVVHRLVLLQRSTRLCIVRDLSEHDIVGRIMRKENYLIGMLNKGVLALHVPLLGRRRLLLTRTMEWNLYWCVLDHMLDDQFHLRPDFEDEQKLQRRFRAMGAANLLLSPFLLIFLLIFFFMRNAEKFYNHPGSIGSRRWSPLAKWRLREFNELPHYVHHRLNASHAAAVKYLSQFPSPLITHLAKFVAFVTGSFAALLLFITMVDDKLLERSLLGRHIVWWVATLGVVLAISRGLIQEDPVACDPEQALAEVAMHTHHLPRHWRGRAHTREVQEDFASLFQFKPMLFLEEVAALLLTPFVLWFSLPRCAGTIIRFVQNYSERVEGVGDVCSLSVFNFERHGNTKYGAPVFCDKSGRSRQGKMEKSFLSFVTTYPTWEPQPLGKRMLLQLAQHAPSPAAFSRHWAARGQQSMFASGIGGALPSGWGPNPCQAFASQHQHPAFGRGPVASSQLHPGKWGPAGSSQLHPGSRGPAGSSQLQFGNRGPAGSSQLHPGSRGPVEGGSWGQPVGHTSTSGAAGPSGSHGLDHTSHPLASVHSSQGWPSTSADPSSGWLHLHEGRANGSHMSSVQHTSTDLLGQMHGPDLSDPFDLQPQGSQSLHWYQQDEVHLIDPLTTDASLPMDDDRHTAEQSDGTHHQQHPAPPEPTAAPHLANGMPGGACSAAPLGLDVSSLPESSLHWINSCMLHSVLLGTSVFGSDLGSGSEALPGNETTDLQTRMGLGHSLLQSFYEDHDDMLQARLHAPQALLSAATSQSFAKLSQRMRSA